MPTYEYQCEKCNQTFEVFQSMKDEAYHGLSERILPARIMGPRQGKATSRYGRRADFQRLRFLYHGLSKFQLQGKRQERERTAEREGGRNGQD